MYFSSLHGHAELFSPSASGAPTECRQGTNAPSSPRHSSAAAPILVMIRMLTAAYGESVSWMPISATGDPSGPIENGTTYIVRPFMAPVKRSVRIARISSGSCQWFVGPASSSRSEQMNVRSSTRATSPGSDQARYEFGRLASESRRNVPASTICWHRRSYSSAEPSHQRTESGVVRATTSSTQLSRRSLVVRADVSVAIWVFDLVLFRGEEEPFCRT